MIRHQEHQRGRTNASGQLNPLSSRLSPAQQKRRFVKIEARRTVAETLLAVANQAYLHGTQLQRRGFWGRLKLVLVGK